MDLDLAPRPTLFDPFKSVVPSVRFLRFAACPFLAPFVWRGVR